MNALLRSAVAILLAVLLGAFVGWTIKGKMTAAGEVKQARAAVKESAQQIVQSAQASQVVETAIQKDVERITSIEVAVAKRIENTTKAYHDKYTRPPTTEEPGAPTVLCPDLHRPVLDAGTVRLLNAARAGSSLESTAGDAAEK